MAVLLLGILLAAAPARAITPPLFRCPFVPGSAALTPLCEDSARALRDYWGASIVAGTPPARVAVIGSVGTAERGAARDLAQRRAAAVARLLVSLGFSSDRLSIETGDLAEPVVAMDPFAGFRCLFAPESAVVSPSCQAALRGFVAMVGEYPAARRAALEIDVNGFTDDHEARSGPPGLASRRASAVAAALRGLGLATQRLNARGHGPEAALRPTSRPDPGARVVGIVVVPPAAPP